MVRSHIYPLPVDNVLAQATALMQKQGWAVKRAGNVLVTNWQSGGTDTLVSYRIFGQRIDAGLCAIQAVRLVATTSTSFGTDHPYTESERDPATPTGADHQEVNPNFVADTPNDAAAGTAPPSGSYSPSDLARPSQWVITQHERDAKLELELQREIDPAPILATKEAETTSGSQPSGTLNDSGTATVAQIDQGSDESAVAQPSRTETRLVDLAGIWDGTFTFKGTVVGSFKGEVTVAVDGRSVELDDFCPDNGGALNATGANSSAAWEGNLSCSSIPIKGCPAAALTYNFAHATVKDDTLVVVAAGTVETPPACSYSGGALSATFVAQKADYVHLAVTRVRKPTTCLWPSDWEDFNSAGSMSMPDSLGNEQTYLGIIRAKGSRLTEIQKLLRHCHQVVLLHGEPVLMKLAVTRPSKR